MEKNIEKIRIMINPADQQSRCPPHGINGFLDAGFRFAMVSDNPEIHLARQAAIGPAQLPPSAASRAPSAIADANFTMFSSLNFFIHSVG
ncbi:MAG: hypothetical protein V4631_12180 [Pseudomonadota bacterium]